MNEYLQEIVDQYQEDQEQARKELYQLFIDKTGKEDILPVENVRVDRTGDEEERKVISYRNAFEPQVRDMIDTIHQITYHTGKIKKGEGDPKDLETMNWYLEQAEQLKNEVITKSSAQMNASHILHKTVREIPSLEELAEDIPEITNPEDYQQYLDLEV